MNKYVLLCIAFLGSTPVMQAAPSSMNPLYLLPAALGIQGEHINPFNLAQNMIPELVVQNVTVQGLKGLLPAEKSNLVTDKQAEFLAWSDKQFTKEKRTKASTEMGRLNRSMLAKYLLTFITPIGRRAPKDFRRSYTQQLASILRFVDEAAQAHMPALSTKVTFNTKIPDDSARAMTLVRSLIQHVPEIFYRQSLVSKLSKKGLIVSSWSVPKHMRSKNYLMFQGPLGYLQKNLSAIENIFYLAAQFGTSISKKGEAEFAKYNKKRAEYKAVLTNLRHALALLSITPKYYILESDYKKLPATDKIAVYQAVYEDVTAFSDRLAYLAAPYVTKRSLDDVVALGKAVKADPKKVAQEKWTAAQAKAKAQFEALKKSLNDLTK